jgi:hypothetical protein
MSLPLNPAQLKIILDHGAEKNYGLMYGFIAEEMQAGRIPGATTDQIYWFLKAGVISV